MVTTSSNITLKIHYLHIICISTSFMSRSGSAVPSTLPCILRHARGNPMILASGLWQSTPLTFGCLLLLWASGWCESIPCFAASLLFCLGIKSLSCVFQFCYCGATSNIPTEFIAEVSCTVGALVPLPKIWEKFKTAAIWLLSSDNAGWGFKANYWALGCQCLVAFVNPSGSVPTDSFCSFAFLNWSRKGNK